jgi:hypothetical protein
VAGPGARPVPIAVLGERRLSIFHVDQLRGFLGLPLQEGVAASYQAYVAALERVLEAVERAVRQVPDAQLSTPTPNRGRDLRELAFNIHDPISRMRNALDSGTFLWATETDFDRSRHFQSAAELADFCRDTRVNWLERAAAVDDDAARTVVQTARGVLTQQQVLEAQAGHAAQHLRQIYVFLREIGVEPRQELTRDEMVPIILGDMVF